MKSAKQYLEEVSPSLCDALCKYLLRSSVASIMEEYAREVAKEALRMAANNAKLQVVNIDWRSIEIVDRHSYSVSGGHGEGQNKWAVFVYSDSITDSKNIPTPDAAADIIYKKDI